MATGIKERGNMGRVVTEVTVENLGDLYAVRKGELAPDKIRRVTIQNALVDTGATCLSLPTSVIKKLGLVKAFSKRVMTSRGPADADVYDAVRMTIQGRSCTQDVMEVPDPVPALVGQLPLEALDLVVDPLQQKVTGNPEHGGEQMYDLL